MNNQKGNVLFLILIAVVLFAALSYAVTSSTRTGEGNISEDKAKMLASEIVQYAALLGNASNRLKIIAGCADTEISYLNTKWVGAENPNAPVSKKCHLFDAAGAGLTPYNLPIDTTKNWYVPPFIRTIQVVGAGTSASDVIFVLNGLSSEVCEQINKSIGLPLPTIGDAKAGWYSNYWLNNNLVQLGEEDTSLQNNPYFCWNNTDDSAYTFAYILLVR